MPEPAATPASIKKIVAKPKKDLPTDRIAFQKQLEMLRAYAAASGQSGKAVTNNDVAKITGMTAATVSLANTFFASVGFLKKQDPGYVPSAEVVAFARAYEWDRETATHKLAPLIAASWFAEAILPVLSIRPMAEQDAIAAIADAAAAGTEHAARIRMLLDYLKVGGLIKQEGKQITATPAPSSVASSARAEGGGSGPIPTPSSARPVVPTTVGQPTEGAIQFDISVRVRMSEMAAWSPERISAFFSGVAQVLSARGSKEDSA